MRWTINYAQSALKGAKNIDAQAKRKIRSYLNKRIATLDDPRQLGKSLKGQFTELWKYRVGNYRIICDIKDQEITILVLRIAHRKDAYKRQI